jgi:hypothetical protein
LIHAPSFSSRALPDPAQLGDPLLLRGIVLVQHHEAVEPVVEDRRMCDGTSARRLLGRAFAQL